MEFAINQTPFKLEDAAAKLFNSPFLSDITFIIGDKQIYAHSLILMMRSSVFQEQLESTLSEKKNIPIVDYEYEVFYGLIRYIYTDQHSISEENHVQLLKLAKVYNMIRLVNEVINSTNTNMLETLEFCIEDNFEVALNDTKFYLSEALDTVLKWDGFLSMHPNSVAEILKLDDIEKSVTEIGIINALVRWMNQYCTLNGIQFRECCQKFENLIRLIRFPTLTIDELRDIKTKYPDLLTKDELQAIVMHKIYGIESEDEIWNCIPRKEFLCPYKLTKLLCNGVFETKFTVSSELILGGFVFGSYHEARCYDITISCQHSQTHEKTKINIDEVRTDYSSNIISLGASIHVKPNFTYTVGYKNKNQNDTKVDYYIRKPQADLIINVPQNSITILEAHPTMNELFFLKPQND